MDQILRKKFIYISVSVVFVVLVSIAAVINIANFIQIDSRATEIVQLLAENDGDFPQSFDRLPPQISQETPYSTRYFTVKLDENGELLAINTRNIQQMTEEQALTFALESFTISELDSFHGNFKYARYDTDYGTLLLFVDCSQDLISFNSLLTSSIMVCVIALGAVFLLIVLLSKKAVAPIAESYRKQQQFITNISHELKTPLAIMKTNTEVIEIEHGTSQWSESIHNQIGRLNGLVNYLVSLSKMEEEGGTLARIDFPLSDIVSESVDAFHVLAESNGTEICTHIAPNLTYHGDEQSIRLLLSILLENAVKYSHPQTIITVDLRQHKGKVQLSVTNAAENLQVGNYDMLFERFYRMDDSRNSKTGGFGIGLAVANTIVHNHGGEITAFSKDGTQLCITASL